MLLPMFLQGVLVVVDEVVRWDGDSGGVGVGVVMEVMDGKGQVGDGDGGVGVSDDVVMHRSLFLVTTAVDILNGIDIDEIMFILFVLNVVVGIIYCGGRGGMINVSRLGRRIPCEDILWAKER